MNVDKITARLLSAYGFTIQKQLTDQLEISHSSIAGWRSRGKVPKSALFQCVAETGYNLLYLQTGEGKPKEKLTQNEFRFVFERLINAAILGGVLKAGENWSNSSMLAISDEIYQSIMQDEVFETLFVREAENKEDQPEP